MLCSISMRQLNEWREYADLEPFDEERADLRAAQVVQAVVNYSVLVANAALVAPMKRKPTIKAGSVKLRDCLLQVSPASRKKSAAAQRAEVRRALDAMAQIFGTTKGA